MATLSDRLIALAQTIGADIKAIHHKLSGRLVVKDGSPINGWLPSNADDAGIAAGSIIHAGQSNTPVSDWTQMLSNAGASFGWQLASPWHHNSLYVRNRIATTFHPWRQIWDSGNSARLVTGDADPGAIGAGAVWVRTSYPMGLHVRNGGNSGWIRIGGGGMQVQKQQIFTTSGTFTPPPGMIAQGGHCEVFLVGGGQNANGYYVGSSIFSATEYHARGGAGGAITRKILHGIVQPQHVHIGAGSVAHVTDGGGGRKNIGSISGGTTLFGLVARANGGGISMSSVATGGTCSYGEEASSAKGVIRPRHPGVGGYGQGGYGVLTQGYGIVTSSNSGNGGSFAPDKMNGSNGICIVTWWEAAE